MSDKNPADFRDPDNLTVSEIDRYVDYRSESDDFSSNDSYRPSGSESSDGDLENSTVTTPYNVSSCPSDSDTPGPSGLSSTVSTSPALPTVNITQPPLSSTKTGAKSS
uniref:Uncharacterized protein n=1 Tax=Clastoptera arizonana TaxID=38151 RepID=A0A1B6CIY1_9HEMI